MDIHMFGKVIATLKFADNEYVNRLAEIQKILTIEPSLEYYDAHEHTMAFYFQQYTNIWKMLKEIHLLKKETYSTQVQEKFFEKFINNFFIVNGLVKVVVLRVSHSTNEPIFQICFKSNVFRSFTHYRCTGLSSRRIFRCKNVM